MPGWFLLRVAALVFDESVLTSVVRPALADFQAELRAAPTPSRRLLMRWRGYRAFWTLVALALGLVRGRRHHPARLRPANTILA